MAAYRDPKTGRFAKRETKGAVKATVKTYRDDKGRFVSRETFVQIQEDKKEAAEEKRAEEFDDFDDFPEIDFGEDEYLGEN